MAKDKTKPASPSGPLEIEETIYKGRSRPNADRLKPVATKSKRKAKAPAGCRRYKMTATAEAKSKEPTEKHARKQRQQPKGAKQRRQSGD